MIGVRATLIALVGGYLLLYYHASYGLPPLSARHFDRYEPPPATPSLWLELGRDGTLAKWRAGAEQFVVTLHHFDAVRHLLGASEPPWAALARERSEVNIRWFAEDPSPTDLYLYLTDGPQCLRTSMIRRQSGARIVSRFCPGRWIRLPLSAEERKQAAVSFTVEPLTGQEVALAAIVAAGSDRTTEESGER